MTDRSDLQKLEREVEEFAGLLTNSIGRALGNEVELTSDVTTFGRGSQKVSLYQSEETGIPLTIGGRVVFRLVLRYECVWSEHPDTSGAHYLTVDSSAFTVNFDGRSEPFLHFDYLRRPSSATIPTSHINVHAHRDEVVHAMLLASRKRGKARAKRTESGALATMSQLHLPLGGARFRPSIEDLIEMLIVEFGVDAAPEAQRILADSRATYRSIQVAAAAADDPEAAARTLRNLGYEVVPPPAGGKPRPTRLRQY